MTLLSTDLITNQVPIMFTYYTN